MDSLTAWYQTIALAFLLSFTVLLTSLYRQRASVARSSGTRPIPPGPPGLPILGNLFDFPKHTYPWMGYRELNAKYGDMVFLQVFSRKILIINSADIAFDLLEKRSAIWSSRPESNMIKLAGWDKINFAFMPYGQRWRHHRRIFWQYFHPSAVHTLEPAQGEGVRLLLSRLLRGYGTNKDIEYAVTTALCRAAHGLEVDEEKMMVFRKATESNDQLTEGATVLEYLPCLSHIPTWLPGTGLLRQLADNRNAAQRLRQLPWEQAKEAVNSGKYQPSIASTILEKLAHVDANFAEKEEQLAMGALALTYAAGTDTMFSTLKTFFVACMLHPEAQYKAQAELDRVVGPRRLPVLADRSSLPYVNAIVKETFRWHPVVPLTIGHASVSDDEYGGYHIPAGTVAVVNAWAILYDQARYPRPEEFMPERFLEDGKPNPTVHDPMTAAFGFGRRICPGRYFADATLFLFVASVLHVFSIIPSVDEEGREVRVKPRATAGLVSCFEDWDCMVKFQLRFAGAEDLAVSL